MEPSTLNTGNLKKKIGHESSRCYEMVLRLGVGKLKAHRRFEQIGVRFVELPGWMVHPVAFPGRNLGDTRRRESGGPEETDTIQRCRSRLQKRKSRAWMVGTIPEF